MQFLSQLGTNFEDLDREPVGDLHPDSVVHEQLLALICGN